MVDLLGEGLLPFFQIIDAGDPAIGTDADRILAAHLDGVLDVTADIFAGDLPIGEKGHEIDADIAALLGDETQFLVSLVTWHVVQSAAAGVADADGRLGIARCVEAGLLAAVRQVDDHAAGVQAIYHLAAKGVQRRVAWRHGTATQLVLRIVGQLDHAHAHVGEQVHAVGAVAHHRRVLETVDYPHLALELGAADVGRGRHLDQGVGMITDHAVETDEVTHRGLERLLFAADIAQGPIGRRQARGDRVVDDPPTDRRGGVEVALVRIFQFSEAVDDDEVAQRILALKLRGLGGGPLGRGQQTRRCRGGGGKRRQVPASEHVVFLLTEIGEGARTRMAPRPIASPTHDRHEPEPRPDDFPIRRSDLAPGIRAIFRRAPNSPPFSHGCRAPTQPLGGLSQVGSERPQTTQSRRTRRALARQTPGLGPVPASWCRLPGTPRISAVVPSLDRRPTAAFRRNGSCVRLRRSTARH